MAFSVEAIMSVENTGGGAHIGGNASAGNNYTGRDSSTEGSHENQFNFKLGNGDALQQEREGHSLHKRVGDLERYLYGDHRAGEPGLIMRTRTQLRWSQANTVLLVIMLLLVAASLRG